MMLVKPRLRCEVELPKPEVLGRKRKGGQMHLSAQAPHTAWGRTQKEYGQRASSGQPQTAAAAHLRRKAPHKNVKQAPIHPGLALRSGLGPGDLGEPFKFKSRFCWLGDGTRLGPDCGLEGHFGELSAIGSRGR